MSEGCNNIELLLRSVFYAFVGFFQMLILIFTPYSLRMKKSVKGEIVLVTGGGSGFGRLLAIEFAKLGSRIVIWDVDIKGSEKTCRLVKEIGGKINSFILDVSDRNKVYEIAKLVESQVGKVTILINNAGIAESEPFLKTPDVLLEKIMQVNAMSHFWTLKAFLPNMENNNHGHVVCISSVLGLYGAPRASAYTSSKHAINGLMDSVSLDLIKSGKTGVKTTVVYPSFSKTSLWEGNYDGMMPLVSPEEVVEGIIKGVLTNKEFVCVPNSAKLPFWANQIMSREAQFKVFSPLAGKNFHDNIKVKKRFKEQDYF